MSAKLLACKDGSYTYVVADEVLVSDDFIKCTMYIVKLDRNTLDVKCDCNLFEFKGILRRYALRILVKLGKSVMTSKYILDQWRKDAKQKYIFVKDEPSSNHNLKMYDKI